MPGVALSWTKAGLGLLSGTTSILVGGLLSSCGVGTPCAPPSALCNSTTGEGSRYTGAATIERVILECCDPGTATSGTCEGQGEWWVDVTIEGTASRVEVTRSTLDVGGWSEVHTVPLSARDPSGYWELRYGEWEVADTSECDTLDECADLYTSGSDTLLACGGASLSSTRTTVQIYEVGNAEALDCVSWGPALPRPPSDCRDAEEDGVL